MDSKRWIVFGVIVVTVIAGMVYMSTGNRLSVDDIGREGSANVLAAEERNGNIADHVRGDEGAELTIIEYGDFQCPGCKTYSDHMSSLMTKYDGHIRLVYRHFPITQFHPNARAAAAASEAAGLQGKFWEMHDLLFANQAEWSNAQANERGELFQVYARQIALDADKFTEDLAGANVSQKINFDVALARLNSVTGTPSFFINGDEVELTQTEDDELSSLEIAIRQALEKAGVELDSEE